MQQQPRLDFSKMTFKCKKCGATHKPYFRMRCAACGTVAWADSAVWAGIAVLFLGVPPALLSGFWLSGYNLSIEELQCLVPLAIVIVSFGVFMYLFTRRPKAVEGAPVPGPEEVEAASTLPFPAQSRSSPTRSRPIDLTGELQSTEAGPAKEDADHPQANPTTEAAARLQKRVPEAAPQAENDVDAQIAELWDKVQALKWASSPADRQERVDMLSTLLNIVDQGKETYDKAALYRIRAMTYANLKEHDLALADLEHELALTTDPAQLQDCKSQIERIRRQRAAAGTDDKAKIMQDMERYLMPDAEGGFDQVFAYLSHEDADIRGRASEVFSYHRDALQKLADIYHEDLDQNPRRAVLAGRVLGRKMSQGSTGGVIEKGRTMMRLGLPLTFITCNCVHCGHANVGIPCPEAGIYDCGSETSGREFAYALPVLCDSCGKEFFVAWSYDPRKTPV